MVLCECGCGKEVKIGKRFIFNHHLRGKKQSPETIAKKTKPKTPPTLCECGCGGYAKSGNRYICGHTWRGRTHTPETRAKLSESRIGVPLSDTTKLAMSKAGTGRIVSDETRLKLSRSLKRHVKSAAHRKALSHAKKGIPMSDDSKLVMSIAHKNSDAAKANSENQRGGNDIVGHHFAYDHADISKYVMDLTRSEHTTLHNNMRILGLKVPHINIDNGELL